MTDAPAPTPVAGIQILVMDDSRSARFALGKFLESLGCTVTSVGDLAAALACLNRSRPQLMFLDQDLDDSGFEALRAIKLHAAGRLMPVVLCLSDEIPGFDAQALAHGADGVMVKPPTRLGLAALLSTLVPGIVLPARAEIVAAPDNTPSAIDGDDDAEEISSGWSEPSRPVTPPLVTLTVTPPLEAEPRTASVLLNHSSVESRLQQFEARLGALEQNVQRELMELRVQLDLSLQAQSERIDQSREAIRAMAAEEAQVIAERTVMGAAAKISDRLAESILKTLGKA
ncbi:MAG: response regulator receiver [Hydrocarboniphaga sp.]|uniref:response regulator n=1 Tax=Hydrocarboniphaga sp. TaxID=2033016 RepID=UPI002634F70A|nr:response regulator [Hydrocarboniphaga sp.]MDB5970915.1 response regulator receiver [Hydrocarboniphaga sp.]